MSRICIDLCAEVRAFRDWSLTDQQFPYAFLDNVLHFYSLPAVRWVR